MFAGAEARISSDRLTLGHSNLLAVGGWGSLGSEHRLRCCAGLTGSFRRQVFNYLRRCLACLLRSYHGSVAVADYRTSHCWRFEALAASMGAAVTHGVSEVPDTSMLPLLRCTLVASTADSRVAAGLVGS